MNKKISCCFYIIGLLSTALLSRVALANQNYMFCPKTANYIYLGASIIQVEEECGKPDSRQIITVKKPSTRLTTVQWIYNNPIKQGGAISSQGGSAQFNLNPNRFSSGVLVLTAINNRVTRITSNNSNLTSAYCSNSGQRITIDMPLERVKMICGSPDYAQTILGQQLPAKREDRIIYTYKQGYTSTRLIFRQLKLVQIKTG